MRQSTIAVFLMVMMVSCGEAHGTTNAVSAYGAAQHVWMRPGIEQRGIRLLYEDRLTETDISGKKCVATNGEKGNNYINFDVDDSFIFNGDTSEVIMTIEYFDLGTDTFAIQYDSTHRWPYHAAIRRAGKRIKKTNTKTWKTYTTRVRDIKFANRQGYGPAPAALLDGGGGDFRIYDRGDGEEYIGYVQVRIPYITVSVNETGNIFSHQDASVTVHINNRMDVDLSPTMEYAVSDWKKHIIASEKKEIKIPKNTRLPYELNVPTDEHGVFYLHIELHQAATLAEEYNTTFGVCGEPVHAPSEESPFGVAVGLQYNEIDRIITMLRRLGISWARYDFRPGHVELQNGNPDWTMSDRVVSAFYENGIHSSLLKNRPGP